MQTMHLLNHLPARLRKFVPMLALLIVTLIATGCAVNQAPPAVVCDTLNRGIYTLRLIAAGLIAITVALIGFSLVGQKVLKTNVAIGAAIIALIGGVVLMVAAPDITTTILTAGGTTMPDIVTLCAIT